MNESQGTGMSKKAFGAGVAIAAIAGSDGDMPKLIAITLIAVTAIVVQGVLDSQKKGKINDNDGSITADR